MTVQHPWCIVDGMSEHNTTVNELDIGDVVVSLETTVFKSPVTVTKVSPFVVYVSGGGFWPKPQLGSRNCVVRS